MGGQENGQKLYPGFLVKLAKCGIVILVMTQIFILFSCESTSKWFPTAMVSFFNSSSWNKSQSTVHTELGETNKPQILIWTSFYSRDGVEGSCIGTKGQERQEKICKHSCTFTTNRDLIDTSHAVVFHGRDLKIHETKLPNGRVIAEALDLPRRRNLNQYWTFLMFESPVYTWGNLLAVNNIFNWTMSFRQDSDVYIPYGNIVKINSTKSYNVHYYNNQESPFLPTSPPLTPPNFETELKAKTKMVAWIVSNCEFQQSGREKIASKLRQYIPVDIYGKCGLLKCQMSNSVVCDSPVGCYQEISKSYKFYLAFENSLCKEYVTEKLFYALFTDLVPVVYGQANYSMFAPKGSFINANDFKSVEGLAGYLKYLNNNNSAYLEYFEWKKEYYVENIFYIDRAWCSLCNKLWQTLSQEGEQLVNLTNPGHHPPDPFKQTLAPTIVDNLYDWWYNRHHTAGVCVEPSRDFASTLNLFDTRIAP